MTVRSALEGAEVEPEASAPVTEPAAPEATPAVSGPDAEAPDVRETEPEPERILPQGTAYITDLGMVGPWNSVLGVKTEIILQKFTTAMPCRFDLEESGPMVYSALIVDIDDSTNRTTAVERILIKE